MSRGLGEFEPIQHHVPEWLAVLVGLVTQLGDIWFVGLVFVALYWFDAADRDGVATVAGVWLAGIGLYSGLKETLALPRPDRPLLDPELLPSLVEVLYEATALATGYGFPSGHAVGTTVAYVGLAHVLDASTPRRRYGVAAALVATVCTTRVVLGVHYVVDVVAGVGVGLLLLVAAGVLVRSGVTDPPSIGFGLAVGFGAFFAAASGAHPESVVLLAASLGALAGWQFVVLDRRLVADPEANGTRGIVTVRGGIAAAALAAPLLALPFVPPISAYAAASAVAVVAAAVVAVPSLRRVESERDTDDSSGTDAVSRALAAARERLEGWWGR